MATATTQPRVVVGVDGSARAELAVAWAAEEAVRRGLRLHILHAFPLDFSMVANDLLSAAEAREMGERICEAAADRARTSHPGLRVSSEVRLARPAPTLVDASRDAAVLVVAARGRGAVSGKLLGSVSRHVAANAHSPVVVIRHPQARGPLPVVVGVDRSARSTAALAFALADASRRGVPLRAVHATHADVAAGTPAPDPGPSAPRPGPPARGRGPSATDRRARRAGTEQLLRSVMDVASRFPAVEVDFQQVRARPVEALLRQSGEAGLLVVGSRGLAGLTGLVRGSVSQGLLSRAECAVAVVRG
ncbi:universal stress protein [Georgenia sp. SYP-B2076]|uniref:universal stress protein n=1 Tax=Georgenia sp. SYP-B2076 TaxID=2495881 RepID=UPI000F8E2FF6|nr:universal stress protein [Georgenia sp. SYP-B2076]